MEANIQLNDLFKLSFEPEVAPATNATLSENLSTMLNNPEFSDVTFNVEGEPVHAHKMIMSARSEHFRAMFSERWSQSPEVEVPDIRKPVFLALLEYLYTGKVDINIGLAIELLTAADQYTMSELKDRCVAVLLANITVENVSEIFTAADRHEVDKLRVKCMDFILQFSDEVFRTESFRALSIEHVHEILAAAAVKLKGRT